MIKSQSTIELLNYYHSRILVEVTKTKSTKLGTV